MRSLIEALVRRFVMCILIPPTEIGMHTEIEKHRQALTALCQRYGVVRLEVFGSAARGVDFDPAISDADFLVAFGGGGGLSAFDQFLGFSEALQRLLGRPVDLVEASAVKNPYVRATIERSRELIYAA
ncbi:nucleotidyltransferase family protein [Bradyrhizobium centrosematis]|uniref:nucleotidyltransferase family protein n=1 Tax=Bradyrhizobium centrosematis TaxID=1300039 RepID=UPI0038910436